MVTIHRAHGLRFVIFTDDHVPAQVHVFGDGEAKFNLTGRDGTPELIYAIGMNFREASRAMKIVGDMQQQMIARWSEIHG